MARDVPALTEDWLEWLRERGLSATADCLTQPRCRIVLHNSRARYSLLLHLRRVERLRRLNVQRKTHLRRDSRASKGAGNGSG